MINQDAVAGTVIENQYMQMKKDAESAGYSLNPDIDFTRELVKGLLINTKRYGYAACPCRLASGIEKDDLDIICPCDYRDPDLTDYGACFCGLYVSENIASGKQTVSSIPDRRLVDKSETRKRKARSDRTEETSSEKRTPVWRCRVCGYLCARDDPPEICPICKAKKDRFERFDF